MIVNKEPRTATPMNWLPTYYLSRMFNAEECATIIKESEDSGLFVQGRTIGDNNVTVTEQGRQVAIIQLAGGTLYEMMRQRILERLPDLNSCYQFELFGADEVFKEIHILKYVEGNFHGEHLDLAGYEEMCNRKLSLIVQLNPDYEGGELVLYNSYPEKPLTNSKQAGDAVVFPAWMPHEVRPVDYGTRYVLVVWLTGPKFR